MVATERPYSYGPPIDIYYIDTPNPGPRASTDPDCLQAPGPRPRPPGPGLRASTDPDCLQAPGPRP